MYLLLLLDSARREAAMALGLLSIHGLFSKKTVWEEDPAYFKVIDHALKHKADRKVANCKPAHTVYLLKKFFSCARKEMRIYTGRLSRSIGEVSAYADPEVAASAIEFLRRENTRLSIIILGNPDVDVGQPVGSHPLLAAIAGADGIRGTVSVSRGDPREWKDFPYHLVIMDKEAVRIEFDGKSTDAAAMFGDAHLTVRLARIFDEFQRSGTPLFRTGPVDDSSRRADQPQT